MNEDLNFNIEIIGCDIVRENDEKLVNFSKKDSSFSCDELFDISKQIFTDNFNLTTYTKRISLNQNLEAYILPIYYQLTHFGIMIFFNIKGTCTLSDELIDSIRIYITAACIGNHLITSNQNTLQKYIHTETHLEISLKKLFEWRLKEIINNAINPLINNKGLVRNRRKIEASVNNAIRFLEIQDDYGSFDKFIWNYVEYKPIINSWKKITDLPSKTKLSDEISDDLKIRGFKFVGSTIIYSHMQAIGLVNDHLVSCFRYNEINNLDK